MRLKPVYIFTAAAVFLIAAIVAGCTVKYSLTGASIPAEATTVSIEYFPNNAPTVAPVLSSTLTDLLRDRFARQTKLQQVNDGSGDLRFQGEIIGYAISPAAVSGTDEMSTRNRLTVTVRVSFVSIYAPQWNFNNRTFSAFEDYDTTQSLSEAENVLIPQIVEKLVDDIFNASVANW